jgi:type IV fimbrial biogenesis protein FimT
MNVETRRPRGARGLTLLEAITTLAVAGISLAVVVPSWSALTSGSQITTTANQLLTHLRYARNEAVNRNSPVSLCPSDDGTTCSGDTRGWQRGYILFKDTNGDRRRSADEPLLHVQDAQAGRLQIHSTKARPAVRYRPDGAAWSTNTTFSICLDDDAGSNRAVVVYGSGRARVARHAPGNQPVTCS